MCLLVEQGLFGLSQTKVPVVICTLLKEKLDLATAGPCYQETESLRFLEKLFPQTCR